MHDELSPEGMMALAWAFTAFSLLLTIGRQALRFTTTSRFRLEDVFHGIAQLLLVTFSATFTAWLRYDQAAHAKVNTLGGSRGVTNPQVMVHYSVAIATQFWSCMCFVKFGFLILYRSIFKVSRGFMIAWWIVLVFNLIAYLACFLSVFWFCDSPKYVFDAQHCMTHKSERHGMRIITMATCVNVVTDISIMALPLSMLRTIQMPKKQKVGLAAVFCLGLVDLSFDVIRIYHTIAVKGSGAWAIWDILEPCIAVIASALPPYKILLASSKARKFSPRKPRANSSQTSDEAKRQSSGASDSSKRPSLDPYSHYLDDKVEVVTTVRPVLSPSPTGSAFSEFREDKVVLNTYNFV